MLTFPDYPRASWIQNLSYGLQNSLLQLLSSIIFYFLRRCKTFKFSLFSNKYRILVKELLYINLGIMKQHIH